MDDEKMDEIMEVYASGNTGEALRLYDLNFEDALLDVSCLQQNGHAELGEKT